MGNIVSGPGGPLAIGPTSGGKLYAYNALDAVTGQQVAPANQYRQQITFHNPGAVDIIVYPQYKVNSGSNANNAVTVAAPGGGFRVYANGGEKSFSGGEIQGAWYALAASGSTGTLSVLDSNT